MLITILAGVTFTLLALIGVALTRFHVPLPAGTHVLERDDIIGD